MKQETELEAEWESFEWLLIEDLKRGDMKQFRHRLKILRGNAAMLGCRRTYLDEQIPKRIEKLQQKLNRGVIVYG